MLWSSSLAWRGEEFKWSSQRSFPWSFWGVLQSVCTGLLSSRAPVIAICSRLASRTITYTHISLAGQASVIVMERSDLHMHTNLFSSNIVHLSKFFSHFYTIMPKDSTVWLKNPQGPIDLRETAQLTHIHKLAVIIIRGKTDVVASVNSLMLTMKGWYLTKKKKMPLKEMLLQTRLIKQPFSFWPLVYTFPYTGFSHSFSYDLSSQRTFLNFLWHFCCCVALSSI